MKFNRFWKSVLILFFVLVVVGVYHSFLKPLPEGLSFEGEVRNVPVENIEFLRDLVYNCSDGNDGPCERDQEIFEKVFEMIEDANEFITIDMFLMGTSRNGYKNLSLDLSQALIEKKNENPEMKINFITDSINVNYNSFDHAELHSMKDAGINVVFTDLRKVRDSNIFYSPFWRVFAEAFGRKNSWSGWFFLGGKEWNVRGLLEWANAKANHRKVVIADDGNGKVVSLITSANPDDWGSGYSNVAFYFDGGFAKDFYNSEKSVAEFSGDFEEYYFEEEYSGDVQVQLLTEGKIREGILSEIDATIEGEEIDMAMFLLSERNVLGALENAAKRGVKIRLILDPSTHLFSKDSGGIPNVAGVKDLMKNSNDNVEIVWYDSGNQEFHSKMTVIRKSDGMTIVFLGSANMTRRNIGDYNLEAIVKVVSDSDEDFVQEIYAYFEMLFNNEGANYVVPYDSYEVSFFGYLKYRFQEASGFGAF